MMRKTGTQFAIAIFLTAAALAAPGAVAADPREGRIIAERWCASCHLVSPEQVAAADGVPSFQAIAASPDLTPELLRVLLAGTHPIMPDMALTRQEIANLLAYINSLKN